MLKAVRLPLWVVGLIVVATESWTLFWRGPIMPNVMQAIYLFVSLGLIIALATYAVARAVRFGISVKLWITNGSTEKSFNGWAFLWFALPVVGLFAVTATVMDWSVGTWIRPSVSALPFLPQGNLVFTTGPLGWTFVVIAMLTIAVLTFDKARKRISDWRTSLSQVSLQPVQQSERHHTINDGDSTETEIPELLRPLFQTSADVGVD